MPDAHYSGHRRRLKARFIKGGREALNDYELLELLLTFAIPRRDTKPLAKQLLQRYGSFAAVMDRPPEDLMEISGIGEQAATLLRLTRACMTQYLAEENTGQPVLDSPQKVIRYVRSEIGGLDKEVFMLLCLDSAGHLIVPQIISHGTVNQTAVYPREVMETALKNRAAAMILVHNHPSGSLTPSQHDRNLTTKIRAIGDELGINVHDHLIVTRDRAYSIMLDKILE